MVEKNNLQNDAEISGEYVRGEKKNLHTIDSTKLEINERSACEQSSHRSPRGDVGELADGSISPVLG